MPGPISNPSLPGAVCIQHRGERQDSRLLPSQPRRRRFDAELGGAHIGPRHDRLTQQRVGGTALDRHGGRASQRDGRTVDGESEERAQTLAAMSASWPSRAASCRARAASTRRGARLERADVAGGEPRLGQSIDPLRAPPPRRRQGGRDRRRARHRHARSSPTTRDRGPSARAARPAASAPCAPRPRAAAAPTDTSIGHLQRGLELLRPERKEQRQDRIAAAGPPRADRRARSRARRR